MIAFKPHSVTVQSVSKGPNSTSPVRGAGTSVQGQMTPKMPGAIYQSWGIETQTPFEFFCEVADASNFDLGYKVTFSGKTFSVKAEPKVFTVGLRADHCKVLLDVDQFPGAA